MWVPEPATTRAGGVTAICALKALRAVGFKDFARVDVLLNASEETGSFGSRDLIRQMAAASDLAINLERGVPTDKALVARKGSAVLTMEFRSRGAFRIGAGKRQKCRARSRTGGACGLQAWRPCGEDHRGGGHSRRWRQDQRHSDHALIKADVRALDAAEFRPVGKGGGGTRARQESTASRSKAPCRETSSLAACAKHRCADCPRK